MIVGHEQIPKKAKLKGHVLSWNIKGPIPGEKYRLEFDLAEVL